MKERKATEEKLQSPESLTWEAVGWAGGLSVGYTEGGPTVGWSVGMEPCSILTSLPSFCLPFFFFSSDWVGC